MNDEEILLKVGLYWGMGGMRGQRVRECMKLAREDAEKALIREIDSCPYYLVFDDAWEKFKRDRAKNALSETEGKGKL